MTTEQPAVHKYRTHAYIVVVHHADLEAASKLEAAKQAVANAPVEASNARWPKDFDYAEEVMDEVLVDPLDETGEPIYDECGMVKVDPDDNQAGPLWTPDRLLAAAKRILKTYAFDFPSAAEMQELKEAVDEHDRWH